MCNNFPVNSQLLINGSLHGVCLVCVLALHLLQSLQVMVEGVDVVSVRQDIHRLVVEVIYRRVVSKDTLLEDVEHPQLQLILDKEWQNFIKG